MNRGLLIAALVLGGAIGLVAVTGGCATEAPAQRAVTEGRTIVSSGVTEGLTTIEEREDLELRARYNPCRCPAPDFEIHVRGRWQRVVIDEPPEIAEQLVEKARELESSRRLAYLWLQGSFKGPTPHPQTGVEYASFEVTDFRVEVAITAAL